MKQPKFEDRPENFTGKDGKFFLVYCPACGRENYAMAVATGACAWCGWKPAGCRQKPRQTRREPPRINPGLDLGSIPFAQLYELITLATQNEVIPSVCKYCHKEGYIFKDNKILANYTDICAKCGKPRGEHAWSNDACPYGKKGRRFHPLNRFVKVKPPRRAAVRKPVPVAVAKRGAIVCSCGSRTWHYYNVGGLRCAKCCKWHRDIKVAP